MYKLSQFNHILPYGDGNYPAFNAVTPKIIAELLDELYTDSLRNKVAVYIGQLEDVSLLQLRGRQSAFYGQCDGKN